jgi:A/G-specific adenine glycosylase
MGRLQTAVTADPDWFAKRLLSWFDQHGRKNLPWHLDPTPYRVWVSEVMLQQTQVTTVVPYFERFMARFPNVHELAAASDDEVMKHWAGLGYYARARNLHACAKQVSQEHAGSFPDTIEALQALPGIGRSTAGAILAQALGKRAVILDGNVKRVLARYRMISGWTGTVAVQKELWKLAEELTPDARLADYTQAIMDLGSMVCRRSNPGCDDCPVRSGCHARQAGLSDQYPGKKPRKPLPEREIYLMVCYPLDEPHRILLEKRPSSGIWGGLWSLPQCEPVHVPSDIITAEYGHKVISIEETGGILHRFTHFQLRIRPLWVQLQPHETGVRDSSLQWCDRGRVGDYGMPKPVRQLVKHFFDSLE